MADGSNSTCLHSPHPDFPMHAKPPNEFPTDHQALTENARMKFIFPLRSTPESPVRTGIFPRFSLPGFTCWMITGILVSGVGGAGQVLAEPLMRVVTDDASGQAVIQEGDTNVLQYHHQTVQPPPGVLAKITADNQKYAQPRSDYIHPLYGPSGEELTLDWAVDHPHHRGIYWAWPEVMLGDQTGDLHALQRVFARPVGKLTTSNGDEAATLEAESDWMWEDKTPIVHEKIRIRAEKAGSNGRRIDLTLTLVAVVDGVSIARRGTNMYGGLNTRLAPAKALAITHHADAEDVTPRMAWHGVSGTWGAATRPASLTIFEKSANPGYPADHIEFPELAWLQPTFPKAGLRHALKKGEPLVLQYRYVIRSGEAMTEKDLREEWRIFNDTQPVPKP